jgi:beta-galactosidase
VDEGNIESHGMGYGKETLANRPDYQAAHLIRDQRMVLRDINHPSVIVWSMGNEAGNGENFSVCYDWIKAYDPSRPVQYERAGGGRNTDIHCPMYTTPDACEKESASNPPKPLIICEYAHAMGDSVGNFKEYWDLIRK